MRKPAQFVFTIAAAFALSALTASAAMFATDLGTGAPPATLGGYAMTPFGADPTPNFTGVTSVALPSPNSSESLTFSQTLDKRTIGGGWATWSHGYTGDVYYNGGTSVTIGLPAITSAFYFYAEPNAFSVYTITAQANDGTLLSINVNGSAGANGYGFHVTGPTLLSSITVSAPTGAQGFAVGEFGINFTPVPEPTTLLAGALLLLPFGASTIRRLRRK